MKIAMIGHKRIPSREGGIEIVVEELSKRLVKLGYEVVCFNRREKRSENKMLSEAIENIEIKDVVRELYNKSDRIVISTNGFFTDKIIDLCKEFPDVGIRISIEGLENTNNEIRGLDDGYNRGYKTLLTLKEMGVKDIGFGMTVQDRNACDLVPLYDISDSLGMEFATAAVHNSFYFVESGNIIHSREKTAENFEKLINKLLASKSPKKWMRAYFNHGLINYIYSQKRLLPCDMSFDTFFIDPYGDVMPCNGTKEKEVMVILIIKIGMNFGAVLRLKKFARR